VGKGRLFAFNCDTQRSQGYKQKERNYTLINSMVEPNENVSITSEHIDDSPNTKAKKQRVKNKRNTDLKLLEECSIGYIDDTYQFILPKDESEVEQEDDSISLDKLNIFKVLGIQSNDYSEINDRKTSIEFIKEVILQEDSKYKHQPNFRKTVRKILNYETI
jgi:hypothetical protein